MIKWDSPDTNPHITRAFPCELNKGMPTHRNSSTFRPARIYVDDALMAAICQAAMETLLAAAIEAIFTVLGNDEPKCRQCPLAMDKWETLIVSTKQTMLGLVIDTTSLTVSLTPQYISEI